MSLLCVARVTKSEGLGNRLSWYHGWLDLQKSREVQRAVACANVNILRRGAPFAYLFASGEYADGSFMDDLVQDREYIESLDRIRFNRGIGLENPLLNNPTSSLVIAILVGDVLPFVHLLEDEEFGLLCLPRQLSLRQLEHMVSGAPERPRVIESLLGLGGCFISIIDGVKFTVVTREGWVAAHFE